MTNGVVRLSAEQLRRRCDPASFGFESTADLPPLREVIGQERAVSAVAFGIDIGSPGYHMYALGPVGTGKTTTIRKFLHGKAEERPVPDDWCYVNNFEDSERPRAIRLRCGMGAKFRTDMDRFVEDLRAEVPRALESEQYQQQVEQIEADFAARRQELFQQLQRQAEARNFALLQTPQGIGMAPIINGSVITPDQFAQLDEERRHEIEQRQRELQDEMREAMRRMPALQKDARDKLEQLDRQVVGYAVGHLIDDLKEKYAEFPEVVTHLGAVQADILDNVQMFKQLEQLEQAQQQQPLARLMGAQISLDQYRANLVVDNSRCQGAPVVFESNPTFQNLVGRVEFQAQFGALTTNFTMIRGGALHKANGGYLMVEARNILTKPFAWDALKRALKNKDIRVETMGEEFRAIATRTLEPEPIPLDIKVVVVGDPMLYYMLHALDEDFQELFKVKADFGIETEWDDEAAEQYAQFVGTIVREEGLRHFDRSGVARVVERGARIVSDQKRISTRFGDIVDLVRESSYWASRNGNEFVSAEDVEKAIDEKVFRSNRLEERIRDMIEEGTILIDTEGSAVGQINGLSVIPLGDYSFGRPSRITARVSLGRAGVVAIDREAGLGGPIHNKGVMILAGYLGGKYAEDVPLSLAASITFEQLYEGVEGDSASSAELYALLSALSGFPINQELAVTGSVNQHGRVQAIGGVNEKIEGYFAVCKVKGFTGNQGVLIPESNVKHLMLKEEVIDAVRDGRFRIYSVSTIDEGIGIMTGKDAGERRPDGSYPEGTVNRAVQARLQHFADVVKEFGRGAEEPAQEKQKEPQPVGTGGQTPLPRWLTEL